MDFLAAEGSTGLIRPSDKAERIRRATFTELYASRPHLFLNEAFVMGERFT